MIYLLDTDHVSLSQRGHPLVSARIQAVGPAQLAISVITVEEQLRGWLAAIRNATTAQARVTAYERLHMPRSTSPVSRCSTLPFRCAEGVYVATR